MCAKIFLLLCPLLSELANAASTFDQRQNGNLNVQVDLKDLRIVALMKGGKEEYVDYDYAYDYSEMTIKPQNGTTPRPFNVTSTTLAVPPATNQSSEIANEKDNSTTTNTAAPAIIAQTTTATYNDSQNLAVGSTTTINPVVIDATVTEGATETVEQFMSSHVPLVSTTSLPSATNCKKGFIMNQKGDCEFKLHGPGNALMKLVKLSQRLKLRRENRKDGPGSDVGDD